MTGLLRSAVPCILVAVLLALTACGGRSSLTSPIGPAEQQQDNPPAVGGWPANGVQVSPAGSSPRIFCNLREVNGNPAICYPDNKTGAMSFVRAEDADGLNWPNDTVKVGALFGARQATMTW